MMQSRAGASRERIETSLPTITSPDCTKRRSPPIQTEPAHVLVTDPSGFARPVDSPIDEARQASRAEVRETLKQAGATLR